MGKPDDELEYGPARYEKELERRRKAKKRKAKRRIERELASQDSDLDPEDMLPVEDGEKLEEAENLTNDSDTESAGPDLARDMRYDKARHCWRKSSKPANPASINNFDSLDTDGQGA